MRSLSLPKRHPSTSVLMEVRVRLQMFARPPFAFEAVVNSHGWRQLAPFSGDGDDLSYIARLSMGRVIELHLTAADGGVTVEVEDGLSEAARSEIGPLVAWMFGLDQDLSAFYAAARDEPKLAQVAERGQGRILRSPTLFEDVVKTILTTNTAWGSTKRMVANLVNLFGDPLPADPARRAFPIPVQIAASDEATLRNVARLGYRAPYVLELAQRVAAGQLDLEALRTAALPTPELRKRLLALKGVGPYAVANLLMLLGRYDAIPIDSWALSQVSREFHGGAVIGPAEVEAVFAQWGDWKGLVFWFWQWAD
jgi:3-methyladenine DNA glycosylase/8-oxoguanine DNA glycosylase